MRQEITRLLALGRIRTAVGLPPPLRGTPLINAGGKGAVCYLPSAAAARRFMVSRIRMP